jgi:hypothetical protein
MLIEQRQLPNSTLILVFGILSIITCCCYGIIGLPLGIIAIVLANKATKLYAADPEVYLGWNNVKTGKILAIIGVVLNTIYLIWVIYLYSSIGTEGLQEMQEEFIRNINQ